MSDWISVKDRLPEEDGSYLVISPEFDHPARQEVYIANFRNLPDEDGGPSWSFPLVKYWMPKPEITKEILDGQS